MDMKFIGIHFLVVLLIGYTIGVYFPGPGMATRAKLGI